MNLREWVKATHQALANQPAEKRQRDFLIAEVDVILRESISILVKSLQAGDELRLDDLGRLWVEERPPHQFSSNLTGRVHIYELAAQRKVCFRASRRLIASLNQSQNAPEEDVEWMQEGMP